jgi:molecular chaperone GrpE
MTDTIDPMQPGAAADGNVDASDTDSATQAVATDDATQRELQETRDRHLRLAAEFDNFRRRAVKERQEAGWRAQGELVRGILDALDDINRFSNVDPATVDSRTVIEGMQLVERKLMKSLAGHGFEIVNPVDHPFNPAVHEAVSTAPAASPEEDGIVSACFQVGYVINGHVLRPARVVVKQWSGGPLVF